jgi:tRNA U34 5-methylaminomethyl-2-thiouridine-forming methyltransferase MnmC
MIDPITKSIIATNDGSATVYSEHFKETYHSRHGALNESIHVYIKNGLNEVLKQNLQHIEILEIGFGTGLNALLKLQALSEKEIEIYYQAIEPFPLSMEIVNSLNYKNIIPDEDAANFSLMHQIDFNIQIKLFKSFYFTKIKKKIQEFSDRANRYDLVYFDAFSPRSQPELWTKEIFDQLFFLMKREGVFITYSSKGLVQRNLKAARFFVEKLKGPLGKKEILRARKI